MTIYHVGPIMVCFLRNYVLVCTYVVRTIHHRIRAATTHASTRMRKCWWSFYGASWHGHKRRDRFRAQYGSCLCLQKYTVRVRKPENKIFKFTNTFCGVGFRWGGGCMLTVLPSRFLMLVHVCACARCSGVSAARRSSCPQPPRRALPGLLGVLRSWTDGGGQMKKE